MTDLLKKKSSENDNVKYIYFNRQCNRSYSLQNVPEDASDVGATMSISDYLIQPFAKHIYNRNKSNSSKDSAIKSIVSSFISSKDIRVFKYDKTNNTSTEVTHDTDFIQKEVRNIFYRKFHDVKRSAHAEDKTLEISKRSKIISIDKQVPSTDDMKNPKWCLYSMIHSLVEAFDFIVYNKSHLLPHNQVFHCSTKIRIKIPSSYNPKNDKTKENTSNFFILFHGNLIHSGSASLESPFNCMSYDPSFRLFSYIYKYPLEESRASLKYSYENNTRGGYDFGVKECNDYKYLKYLQDDKVKKEPARCDICRANEDYTVDKNNEIVIDLSQFTVPPNTNNKLSPIYGDLLEDGWAVFAGYPISSYEGGFNEMKICLNNLYDKGLEAWKKLTHMDSAKNHAFGRYMYKIPNEKHQKKPAEDVHRQSYEFIKDYADAIINEYVSKIDGFENASSDSKSILANNGITWEQTPHRDYGRRNK